MRIRGKKVIRASVQVGEVGTATAGDQDLLANAIGAFEDDDTPASLASLDGAHQASSACSENDDVVVVDHGEMRLAAGAPQVQFQVWIGVALLAILVRFEQRAIQAATPPRELEKEFGSQLKEPGRGCIHHLREGGTADIAIDGLRAEKLGMVEDVEALKPKLNRLRFAQAQMLEKGHIVVVHPRSVKEAPSGRPRRTQVVLAELASIEIRTSVAWIVVQVECAARVVGLVDAEIIDAIRFRPEQRIVTIIDKSHGHTGAEVRDPR